jgi:predicted nucleic acid-binding protein
MKNALIDTDVILDFFFDRKPFSEFASKILSLCETRKMNGFVTPVMISNIYYLLRKTARHEKVIAKLKQLLLFIKVLDMDKTVVINALNSEFKDFEDALQNFSALKRGKINIILTRNIKDYRKSELGVFTPETFLKTIVQTYT